MPRYKAIEDNYIVANYGRVRAVVIAHHLNRNVKSVEKRAVRLGIQSKRPGSSLYRGAPNGYRHTGVDHHGYRQEGERWTSKGRAYTKRNGQIEMLARAVWSDANGSIPNGYVVRHRDGNALNCDINNLECISLQDHMRRNSIQRFPDDLRRNIMLVARLERKIKNYASQH